MDINKCTSDTQMLQEILQIVKTQSIDIASMKETIIELKDTISQLDAKLKIKKDPVPKKEWTLVESDSLFDFFKKQDIEYTKTKTVEENMTNLCNILDTNIKITSDDKTKIIYQNTDVHTYCKNYTLTTKDGIKIANNKLVTNIVINESNKVSSNKVNATKSEFEKTCTLLNIAKTYCDIDVKSKLIKKCFKEIGLEAMSDEERYIAHKENIRGDSKYLIKDNYVLPKKCFSYDVNSFHGAVLSSNYKFPIRRGMKQKLEKIDSNVFGLYAIKTQDIKFFKVKDGSHNINKIWYSSEYIKMLESENVSYELIQDLDYNAVVYNDYDLMSGETLFKHNIDLLYSEKGNKLCKFILSSIVGHMGQKSYKDKETKLMENLTMHDLLGLKNHKKVVLHKESITVDSEENKYNYVYDTTRFKPFFFDYCKISNWNNYIKKYKDNVIRIYTDSFLLNCKIKDSDSQLNDKLGGLKRELVLPKSTVYPNVTYSFKTNPVNEMLIWNKELNAYEQIEIDEGDEGDE